jgi:DNA-directed RNA polymerase subunit RPC12/RpoP
MHAHRNKIPSLKRCILQVAHIRWNEISRSMAATKPQLLSIDCPACGAHYDVPLSMAGRRGSCASCGAKIAVPTVAAADTKSAASFDDEAEPAQPQYIAVECRVCQTQMYGRPDQVGKEVKCPDCGARTVVPPPPPPKRKNIPAALEGEQYELWDTDEQPLPSQLAAAQPTYIAVRCKHCDTLMYATEKQAGQTIACPDCGKRHVVPQPTKQAAKRSVLASDAETPRLDPAAAPGDRPLVLPLPKRGMDFEVDQDAAYARAREKSERTGKAMEIDSRFRPVLPRFPLLTGILPFPFSAGCRERWAALTIGLLLWAWLIVDGVPAWATWKGDAAGAMAAMGGLAETMLGAIGAILWIAAASNILIAVVSQSAAGADQIREWPPMNFIMSMSEMLPVSVAVVFTAAPGWMLGRLIAEEPWQLALMTGGSLLLGFPVTLLSQLAGNSTWELIELKVLGTMVRCPFSMILFYLESACLAVICAAAGLLAYQYHEYLPLAFAPLYALCLFLYARLLGRLGWRLTEAAPVEDLDADAK